MIVKPNYSNPKQMALHGYRHICALHKLADDEIVLLFFDTSDGEWKFARDATAEDMGFFERNPFPTTVREVEIAELIDGGK